jgi:hypothetical protein
MIDDPNVEMIICPITGALAMMSKPLALIWSRRRTTDKPIFVVWGSPDGAMPCTPTSSWPATPVFRPSTTACRRQRMVRPSRFRGQLPRRSPSRSPQVEAASATSGLLAPGRGVVGYESKQLLTAWHSVTDDRLAHRPPRRLAPTRRLPGRHEGRRDLLHKSDLGLVEVGLTSAAEVKRAYNELLERAQRPTEARSTA